MGIFRTNNMLAGAIAVAALILGGCSAGPVTGEPSALAHPPNAQNLQQAYVSVVQKVLPSVVQITTGQGLGSGIVFDTQGNIVTNAHVVGQATNFQVRLADNHNQSRQPWSVPTYRTTSLSLSSTTHHRRCTQRASVTLRRCRSATSFWPWATRWG